MKTKNILKYTLAAGMLAMTNAQAATTWTGTTNSDFGTNSNWNNSAPGQVDVDQLATINNGDTVNVTTDYTAPNTYRLTVEGGSTLNASGSFTATRFNIGASSTVNLLSGSAFTLPSFGSPTNSGGWTINGTLEMSGGTHAFNGRLFGSGTIRVIGDDADIHFHQISSGSLGYEFEFDATGVSSLIGGGTGIGGSGAGPFWSGLGTSTLDVDGSLYSVIAGPQTYELFNTTITAASTFDLGNVNISGFAHYYDVSFEQVTEGSRSIKRLVIMAPEPSSTALLGLGGLALMLRRKRN